MTSKVPSIPLLTMLLVGCWIMTANRGTARAQAADDAPRQTAARSAATIVIDDSALWGRLPLKDQVADAASLKVPWLFNNTALLLLSQASMETEVLIPEAGTYHLFARSRGGRRGSFRVALGKQVSPSIAGGDAFSWQRVEKFDLPQGPVKLRLTRIFTAPALDVLVLTKNENFTEEELRPLQLNEEVKLLKEYRIPSPLAVNFGDVNDDGKLDFFVMSEASRRTSSTTTGESCGLTRPRKRGPTCATLTTSTASSGTSTPTAVGGAALAAHGRRGVARGRRRENRQVKHKTKWPAPPLPHPYRNSRIAIARFGPGHPNNVVVYSDTGGTISITAYTKDFKQLWQHIEKKQKDHLGHYAYAVDFNGDGMTKSSPAPLVLDAAGKVVWNRFDLFDDNHDHATAIRFIDLDGDGRLELARALGAMSASWRFRRARRRAALVAPGGAHAAASGRQLPRGRRRAARRRQRPLLREPASSRTWRRRCTGSTPKATCSRSGPPTL